MAAAFQMFHRTTVSQAREIAQNGFSDDKWRFGPGEYTGEPLTATGVWLTDRPVSADDGPPGAAVLEVALEISDDELAAFEIQGVLDGARLWVVPAAVVNPRASVRISEVDARSSWFHEQVEEVEDEGEDEDV
jgi:hypothetical protein